MKYYEVRRKRTCKAIGAKDGYYVWGTDCNEFVTMSEVKTFLANEYGKCKRSKMFVDTKTGETRQAGYCYHYNTPKTSHDDTAKNNIDWVEIGEVSKTRILL